MSRTTACMRCSTGGRKAQALPYPKKEKSNTIKPWGCARRCLKTPCPACIKRISLIGHVRYSTTGQSQTANAQPLVIGFKNGTLAIAHNGNLINAASLRSKLEDGGAIFQTTIDTEIIASLIAKNSKDGILNAIKNHDGTDKGVLCRHDHDVRPVDRHPGSDGDPPRLRSAGWENSFILASESCAFDAIDATFIRDVRPGEIIVFDKNGLKSYQAVTPGDSALCIFEFVYFARPDSDIDGISVHQARERAGAMLAIANPIEADIVAGVPDSARTAAMGYAAQSCIPYRKALAQNRYVGRTFIQPHQNQREMGVKIKLNALKRNVYGNRVILVDDSIVRGTTSKKIVEMIRAGRERKKSICRSVRRPSNPRAISGSIPPLTSS